MKKLVLLLFSIFMLTESPAVENAGVLSGFPISLSVMAVDKSGAGGFMPRSPIDIPEVYLDDHTLYIGTAFDDDVTVQLVTVDDVTGGETVEYSTVLYAGDQTVVFPSTLSGTYELRIIVDWYYLAGEVEL